MLIIISMEGNIMKKAFTLAEVLITLGIIGIVAAMTLPTLISRNEEKVAVNKLKKFYSTMSQAYLMSVHDNGYANEWAVGSGATEAHVKQLAQYITPYLKIIRDCGTRTDNCMGYSEKVKNLNGSYLLNHFDAKPFFYKLVLFDGSYMWFRVGSQGEDEVGSESGSYCAGQEGGHSDVCVFMKYDVNGNKGLNTQGIDIFTFVITPKGIFPAITDDCRKTGNGTGCASYILTHDNMDYLR